MIHFLRNKQNSTLIECETSQDNLSSSIALDTYSRQLIAANQREEFLEDFTRLYELRRIWFETNLGRITLDDFVRGEYMIIAEKYDFNYIQD